MLERRQASYLNPNEEAIGNTRAHCGVDQKLFLRRTRAVEMVCDDIFFQVFCWLSPWELLRCQEVCRRFYTLGRHNALWREALLHVYPTSSPLLSTMPGTIQARFRAVTRCKLRRMHTQTRRSQARLSQRLAGWTAIIAVTPATLASIATLSHRLTGDAFSTSWMAGIHPNVHASIKTYNDTTRLFY